MGALAQADGSVGSSAKQQASVLIVLTALLLNCLYQNMASQSEDLPKNSHIMCFVLCLILIGKNSISLLSSLSGDGLNIDG
jgi:hypothetical protein